MMLLVRVVTATEKRVEEARSPCTQRLNGEWNVKCHFEFDSEIDSESESESRHECEWRGSARSAVRVQW